MFSILKITLIDINILIVGNIKDYISKLHRNGEWGGDCEIQVLSEIYREMQKN